MARARHGTGGWAGMLRGAKFALGPVTISCPAAAGGMVRKDGNLIGLRRGRARGRATDAGGDAWAAQGRAWGIQAQKPGEG